MTTPVDPPELPDEELDALASMLSSAAVWDAPAPNIEDQLVAEIEAEVGARPHAPAPPGRAVAGISVARFSVTRRSIAWRSVTQIARARLARVLGVG